MAPKKHTGKKQSRRMRGGMTTGEWGIKVFGGSDSQQAVGNGSNVIRMHDPNVIVAAPPMKGGRKLKGGDLLGTVTNMFTTGNQDQPASGETQPVSDETPSVSGETSPGMFEGVTGLFKSTPTEEATEPTEEATSAPPAAGGKRKSATKRRKSHKKKGKSSKKRAHKRH